jgi:hypothetical protein
LGVFGLMSKLSDQIKVQTAVQEILGRISNEADLFYVLGRIREYAKTISGYKQSMAVVVLATATIDVSLENYSLDKREAVLESTKQLIESIIEEKLREKS